MTAAPPMVQAEAAATRRMLRRCWRPSRPRGDKAWTPLESELVLGANYGGLGAGV